MKRYTSITIGFFLSLSFVLSATHARAAVLSVAASNSSSGVFDVVLDTEGKELNALEGEISFEDGVQVVGVSTGGSIFNLWPNYPKISGQTVFFTGGTASSIFGKRLKIFSIKTKGLADAPIQVNITKAVAYLSDGKGTPLALEDRIIKISADQFHSVGTGGGLLTDDKTPPSPFEIALGRDPSLFEGKYFLSFYASDSESGIDHYEVREGNFPPLRTGNTYTLRDQTLSDTIEVKAYDAAGNVRTEVFNQKPSFGATPFLLLLALVLILFFVIRKKFFGSR